MKMHANVEQVEIQEVHEEKELPPHELYSCIDNVSKKEKLKISEETLKSLYYAIPKDTKCILFYLQFCEKFNKNGYTKSMIKIFRECYILPMYFQTDIPDEIRESKFPYDELFIWSLTLFSGKASDIKLILYYWTRSSYPIAGCIVAIIILNRVNKLEFIPDRLKNDIEKLIKEFRRTAIGLLLECLNYDSVLVSFKEARVITQELLLIHKSIYFYKTVLDLALEAQEYEFLNCKLVQGLLTDIWYSDLDHSLPNYKLFLLILMPPLAMVPVKIFKENNMPVKPRKTMPKVRIADINNDVDNNRNRIVNVWSFTSPKPKKILVQPTVEKNSFDYIPVKRPTTIDKDKKHKGRLILSLLNTPKVKYIYDFILYVLFLIYYTNYLLFDYYPKIITVDPSSESSVMKRITAKIESIPIRTVETFLIFWVVVYQIDSLNEFHQIKISYYKIISKLKRYYSNKWNLYDVVMFSIFHLALIFRFTHDSHQRQFDLVQETYFEFSRLLHAICLILWYIKLFKFLSVMQFWAIRCLIIMKIIKQTIGYLLIILMVIFSFSVLFQAILYKTTEPSFDSAFNTFFKIYWPIFGDFSFLNEIKAKQCHLISDEAATCISSFTFMFLYLSSVVYIIICSLLVLAMLIALLSPKLQDTDSYKNYEQIYNAYRYTYIYSYDRKPWLLPPFAFFSYVAAMFKFCCGKKIIKVHNFYVRMAPYDDTESEYIRFEKENLARFLLNNHRVSDDLNQISFSDNSDKYLTGIELRMSELRGAFDTKANETVLTFKRYFKQNDTEFKQLNEKLKLLKNDINDVKHIRLHK